MYLEYGANVCVLTDQATITVPAKMAAPTAILLLRWTCARRAAWILVAASSWDSEAQVEFSTWAALEIPKANR